MKYVLVVLACAAVVLGVNGDAPYELTWVPAIPIITFDNYTLHADCMVPTPQSPNESFPLVIFPNSWAALEIEYIGKTTEWGRDGYVTCEYQSRGWFESGGLVDCNGPLDQRDITSVIDTLLFEASNRSWQVKNDKIAFVGISYGAGLSLMAGAVDPRVTTVVSMSGWANLSHALFDQQTPAEVYGGILMWMSNAFGRAIPELALMWQDMLDHQNISRLHAFCDVRSAIEHIDTYNTKKIPIFLSNNYLDRLFRPQHMLQFWELLAGPKFMLLNQGLHAQPESASLKDGTDNVIWRKSKRWVDYWLKGVPTGILEEPPLQMQIHGTEEYRMFDQWPDPNATRIETSFLADRNGTDPFGGISSVNTTSGNGNTIYFSKNPGVWSGAPVVADSESEQPPPNNISVTTELLLVPQNTSIVYVGEVLRMPKLLCGTSILRIPTVPSSPWWQMYGFMYDVDELFVGTLIADSYYSCWNNCPRPNQELEFRTICRSIPAGHRIAVGVALYDNLYEPANNMTDLHVRFMASSDATLQMTFAMN